MKNNPSGNGILSSRVSGNGTITIPKSFRDEHNISKRVMVYYEIVSAISPEGKILFSKENEVKT